MSVLSQKNRGRTATAHSKTFERKQRDRSAALVLLHLSRGYLHLARA